jgi:hypothetical protein
MSADWAADANGRFGSNPAVHGAGTKRVFYPLASANPVSVSNFFAYVEDRFVREYAGQRAPRLDVHLRAFPFQTLLRPRRRETSKAPSHSALGAGMSRQVEHERDTTRTATRALQTL